jgi:para-nitrobenzyl esterase
MLTSFSRPERNISNIDLARFVPVFGYEFNDPKAPPVPGFGTLVVPPNDVFGFPTASEHAAELQFLFNFGTPLSADEQQLAGEMKKYWANFVRTGDPNLPKRVSFWLPFNFFSIGPRPKTWAEGPDPFFNFRQQHFCRTWQPFIAAETGE